MKINDEDKGGVDKENRKKLREENELFSRSEREIKKGGKKGENKTEAVNERKRVKMKER